jgi:Fe2+ transport system protein FeoA
VVHARRGQQQADGKEAMDSLWTMKAGEACEILEYDGVLAEPYKVRLMEFGFHPGETVICLQAPSFGAPKVYRVSNTVFSLDDEVASHVRVKSGA